MGWNPRLHKKVKHWKKWSHDEHEITNETQQLPLLLLFHVPCTATSTTMDYHSSVSSFSYKLNVDRVLVLLLGALYLYFILGLLHALSSSILFVITGFSALSFPIMCPKNLGCWFLTVYIVFITAPKDYRASSPLQQRVLKSHQTQLRVYSNHCKTFNHC